MNKKKWHQKFAYRDSRRWLRTHEPHYSALHGKPQHPADIEDMIYEYWQLEDEYKTYKHQQAYHINRGKRLEDTLEPPRSYRWRGLIAIREARGITAHRMQHGHTALKLIHLMYWPQNGEHPLTRDEARKRLGLSRNQARTMHRGFLRLVEERYWLKKGWVW